MGNYSHKEIETPLETVLDAYGFKPKSKSHVKGTAVSASWMKKGFTVKYRINAKVAEKPGQPVFHPISNLEIEVSLKSGRLKEKVIYEKSIKSSRDVLKIMRELADEVRTELSLLL